MIGDFNGGVEVKFITDGGIEVEVFHTGNYRPSDYLKIVGGTLTGNLTLNENLYVKKNMIVSGTSTVKGSSVFEGSITSNKNATLNGTSNTIKNLTVRDKMTVESLSTFTNVATFNENAVFKKSITIEGITKFGNGIEIKSGISRFKDKVLISHLPTYKDGAPTIDLAIGDSDTGFQGNADGKTSYYANGVNKFDMNDVWRSNNFNPNDKFNVSGGTVSGNVLVQGSFHANDDITAFSDIRLKSEIETIGRSECNKLMSIDSYTYKRSGRDEYGVIAQELEKVFPRLVTEGEADKDTGIKYKRVKYIQMIPLLLNSIKTLYNDIKEIKKKLNME